MGLSVGIRYRHAIVSPSPFQKTGGPDFYGEGEDPAGRSWLFISIWTLICALYASQHSEKRTCDALRYDRARLWVLFLDGQCAAVLQAFVDRGVVHYFPEGFKNGYDKHLLGTVMLALSLRDCL